MTAPPHEALLDYVAFNEHPYSSHRKMVDLVPAGSRVLDVGCSSGYLSRRLVDKGCTVVGAELDPAAADVARTVCEDVLVGDIERIDLPADQTFDVVLCGDLVEHLRDPQTFMARVRAALKPGGVIILSTPNVANWSVRLRLLAGRWEYADRGLLDRTHTHLFTRRTLLRALREAGYRPEVVDLTAPVPFIRSKIVSRVAHRIASFVPGLMAYQFVVRAVNPTPPG